MNRIAMFLILPVLSFAACGKSAPAEEPVREPEVKPEATPDEADAAKAAAEQPPEPREKVYKGRLVRTVDGGPAGEGEVELTLADDEGISGKITLEGASYGVSGLLDGDRFRCWIRGGAEEPETVRRGFLEGKVAGDGFEGTFAVSGHGGVEPASGTWSASLD